MTNIQTELWFRTKSFRTESEFFSKAELKPNRNKKFILHIPSNIQLRYGELIKVAFVNKLTYLMNILTNNN